MPKVKNIASLLALSPQDLPVGARALLLTPVNEKLAGFRRQISWISAGEKILDQIFASTLNSKENRREKNENDRRALHWERWANARRLFPFVIPDKTKPLGSDAAG